MEDFQQICLFLSQIYWMGLKDMKYSTSHMDHKYIYGALALFLKLESSQVIVIAWSLITTWVRISYLVELVNIYQPEQLVNQSLYFLSNPEFMIRSTSQVHQTDSLFSVRQGLSSTTGWCHNKLRLMIISGVNHIMSYVLPHANSGCLLKIF